MDSFHIIRYTIVLLVTLHSGEGASKSYGVLSRRSAGRKAKTSLNLGTDVVSSNPARLSLSSGDISTKDTGDCCFNGGLCIMNAFCHCKKPFYGRYCEHEAHHRPCSTIQHGTWMAAGCHLCHCFDGQMRCKVSKIRGCENLSYIEAIEKDPDYLIDVDTQNADYDSFYENGVNDIASLSGSGMVAADLLLCMVVVILGTTVAS